MPKGAKNAAAAGERFARYCELRDDGETDANAGLEVGIASNTMMRYERSYRKARGMPQRAGFRHVARFDDRW